MTPLTKPFRLWTLTDPATGKRRQFNAEAAARKAAAEAGLHPAEALRSSPTYYVMGRGARGKTPRRVNTECELLEDARRWLRRRAREGLGLPTAKKWALDDACKLWLKELGTRGRRPSTLEDYEYLSDQWTRALPGRPLSSVQPEDVLNLCAALNAPRTKNKTLAVLGGFFAWARRRGLTEADPTRDIERWKEPKRLPVVLDLVDLGKLLAACRDGWMVKKKGKRNVGGVEGGKVTEEPVEWEQECFPSPALLPAVVLGLTSLLRLNNVLGLTWGALDLDRRTLRVAAEETKTGRELLIPLAESFRLLLPNLQMKGAEALVFGQESLATGFRGAVSRAGLEGKRITFHALRRTGLTLALRAGVPLEVAKTLGGWSFRGDVALVHYRSVSMEELRAAVSKLDEIVAHALGEPAKVVEVAKNA